jgi:hypothetical protein
VGYHEVRAHAWDGGWFRGKQQPFHIPVVYTWGVIRHIFGQQMLVACRRDSFSGPVALVGSAPLNQLNQPM